jgi:23S rRNA-/tRNA-specific pseudouridylate synthase
MIRRLRAMQEEKSDPQTSGGRGGGEPAAGHSAPRRDRPRRQSPGGGSKAAPSPEPPEFDPARVLFQGEGILAIDKPAGLPVHRGTGHLYGLAEAVEAWARMHPGVIHLQDRPPAPLHRLDLEASGVVLLGLTGAAARTVQAAFAGGLVEKRYLAVVAGPLDETGAIEGEVRSRLRGVYRQLASSLEFRRLAGDERLSLVEVVPQEGRTHQIRALFASAGRPLAGDLRFGKPKPARQFLARFGVAHLLLHARELTLPAGILGPRRSFAAPVPEEFRRVAGEKGWSVPEIGG